MTRLTVGDPDGSTPPGAVRLPAAVALRGGRHTVGTVVGAGDGDLAAADLTGLSVGHDEFERALETVQPSVTESMRAEYEAIADGLRDG